MQRYLEDTHDVTYEIIEPYQVSAALCFSTLLKEGVALTLYADFNRIPFTMLREILYLHLIFLKPVDGISMTITVYQVDTVWIP